MGESALKKKLLKDYDKTTKPDGKVAGKLIPKKIKNILFLPKGKGKNKILTRLKKNSCPRGEAARARILSSEG